MKQSNNGTIRQKGFTILELMVAIFILLVGVVGLLSALQRAVSVTFISSSKLTAAYLAQEGIEIVKNIREANWLEIHKGLKGEDKWANGIPEGNWEADYQTMALSDDYDEEKLKIDGGFYKYSGLGATTPFKRKITISNKIDLNGDGNPDRMTVTVVVEWQERGRNFQVEAKEKLHNWK